MYIEIGKLEGALEQRVNAIFESLDDGEKEACKRIFLRLTQPGEGTEDTKRRASRQEFGESDTVDEVLHKIGEARLITMEGVTEQPEESFVEVSHEALIRGWNRLRDWIEDNRDDLRIQRRLSEAAKEWEKKRRDESYLFRGARLAEAWKQTHQKDLSVLEHDFLQASFDLSESSCCLNRLHVSLIGLRDKVGWILPGSWPHRQ
jgi:hypothetical protein